MKINYAWIGASGESLHELRKRILEYLLEHGEGSPNEMSKALDVNLSSISYHIKAMREYDEPWIVKTKEEPRRGAMEHYYKLVPEIVVRAPKGKAA